MQLKNFTFYKKKLVDIFHLLRLSLKLLYSKYLFPYKHVVILNKRVPAQLLAFMLIYYYESLKKTCCCSYYIMKRFSYFVLNQDLLMHHQLVDNR